MSKSALLTLRIETSWTPDEVMALATEVHSVGDIGAKVASGSFRTDGMVIAPCSVKTLAGVVGCYEDNLLLRAAGVTLKERRRLVMLFRETPLHRGHLRLMLEASDMGATIFPPVPAFYALPKDIDDLVHQTCGRVLDQFGYDADIRRWNGVEPAVKVAPSDELDGVSVPPSVSIGGPRQRT
jgi:4-hydroxy-3-polyprenylbenzoate decarboxylase